MTVSTQVHRKAATRMRGFASVVTVVCDNKVTAVLAARPMNLAELNGLARDSKIITPSKDDCSSRKAVR